MTLIRFLVLFYLLAWTAQTCEGGEPVGRVKDDTKIVFDREIVLKISPPCTLDAEGSKLTVEPLNSNYADFIKSVSWAIGEPHYLIGTPPSARKFNFDLDQRVTFNKEVVVHIFRTTTRVTSKGVIIVCKGSVYPNRQN